MINSVTFRCFSFKDIGTTRSFPGIERVLQFYLRTGQRAVEYNSLHSQGIFYKLRREDPVIFKAACTGSQLNKKAI